MAVLLNDVKSTLDIENFFSRADNDIFRSLQDHGLLRRMMRCTKSTCRTSMTLIRNRGFKGGFAFRCPRCRRVKSAIKKTFFEKSTIPFKTIIIMLWHFLCQTRYDTTTALFNIPKYTVVKYYIDFTDICSWKLNHSYQQSFGGPNTVVHIDEYCITKIKYNNAGQLIPARWVLGIFDFQLNREIAIYVPDRTSEVLIPLICQYVKPGTEIWTNTFSEYSSLETLGQVSPFIHKTVSNSRKFVDPIAGVCRHKVENYWSRLRQFLRRMGITHSLQLPYYIDYFVWASVYGVGKKAFITYLDQIKEKYPVK